MRHAVRLCHHCSCGYAASLSGHLKVALSYHLLWLQPHGVERLQGTACAYKWHRQHMVHLPATKKATASTASALPALLCMLVHVPIVHVHVCRKRQQAAQDAAASQEVRAHALLQQQAQAQKVAAQRKHLEQLALLQQQDPADVTPAQAKYRKEFRDSSVVCLSTEIEQGNVEYKYRLTACATNENRRHQLVSCLGRGKGQGMVSQL